MMQIDEHVPYILAAYLAAVVIMAGILISSYAGLRGKQKKHDKLKSNRKR